MARAIDADMAKKIAQEYLTDPYHVISACAVIDKTPTLTQPNNEPLTLEELRKMDGEPVYIPGTNCWVLVTKNEFVPLFTWPDGEQCSAYDWYEQVGSVYRRPPEGEEDA